MKEIRKKYLSFLFSILLAHTTYSLQIDNDDDERQLSPTENTTDYKLPDNVIPAEYYIEFTPFIVPNNFTFNGHVKIVANVNKRTSKIVLHSDVNEIRNVIVYRVDGDDTAPIKLNIEKITKTEKYNFLNILLKAPVNAGSNILIEILYTGTLYTDFSVAFFASPYNVKNETRWVLGTHMEPTLARNVFPCFDEPKFKAIFEITVKVPPKYTALSNMPAKTIGKDGTIVFQKTPLISTYIIAVVVGELKSISLNDGRHEFKVWSNPEYNNKLSYALSVMTHAVDYFERNLNIPYALEKLEIVALPDFLAVAMENWGLPLYREILVVYEPSVTSITRKRQLRNGVTHELTHQWFGNLVTPKTWDVLWVSEAFATYFEYHAHEDAIASWNLESQFVVNEMQPSFASDASLTTNTVKRKVYSPAEIMSIFDTVVYTKGASLVRMLEKLLGPKMFFGALHRYLHQNEYSLGTPELLYAAIEEELKCNNHNFNMSVNRFLNSWTLQAGFPVVDVHFEDDVATLKQSRFLLKPKNVTDNTTWVIPITYATGSHPNFDDTRHITWFTESEKSIKIKNAKKDWVIINNQQAGYYRVNYDQKMWNRLIETLKSKNYHVIHEINRASLIDDLFNLGRVGKVDYDTVLSATQYLIHETNYVPWRATFEGLTYLKKRFSGHPEIYKYFKIYVILLLYPNYRRLGFFDVRDEKPLDTHLREFVLNWLCDVGHQECINESLNAFKKSRQYTSYKIPANQQSVVYCMAAKYDSNDNWNYLWNKFEKSIYPAERLTILSGLACSRNSTNLERILTRAITPNQGIKKHELEEVFGYVIDASTLGAETAMKFIETNYNNLTEYNGDEDTSANLLSRISENLSTEQHIEKFDNYIKKNKESMSNISTMLKENLQNSIYELNWYNKYGPKILEWFKENCNIRT